MIEVGSDFSGVGAFEQALKRLKIKHKTIFACDSDKYVRQSYIANYGTPPYYPEDVYNREIPKKSLDIYVTTPPCQSFSLSGKRGGEDDERGVLFYNSHEFIKINKPRYFIFENVKGLLSHDKTNKDAEYGNTFNKWIQYLGGKSVNGTSVLFPYEDSAPYHIYWKVLNSKHHGVPQNRERVFIVGIRDDSDNSFQFPKKEHLTKKLNDVLEDEVDEKYFLSEKAISRLINNNSGHHSPINKDLEVASTICASDHKLTRVMNVIQINSATKKGYETAKEGDSINFSVPNSKTRRGRVGKEIAQTLDTACNQAVIVHNLYGGFGEGIRLFDTYSPTIRTAKGGGHIPSVMLGYTRDKKGNVVKRHVKDEAGTIHTSSGSGGNTDQFVLTGIKIRRLTPREAFRLQDFPDEFVDKCIEAGISDTQLFRQAGNSVTVRMFVKLIERFNLKQ